MNDFLTKAYDIQFKKIFPCGFNLKTDQWETFLGDMVYSVAIEGYVTDHIKLYNYSAFGASYEELYSSLADKLKNTIISYNKAVLNEDMNIYEFFHLQLLNKTYYDTGEDLLENDEDLDSVFSYCLESSHNNRVAALIYLLNNDIKSLIKEAYLV